MERAEGLAVVLEGVRDGWIGRLVVAVRHKLGEGRGAYAWSGRNNGALISTAGES